MRRETFKGVVAEGVIVCTPLRRSAPRAVLTPGPRGGGCTESNSADCILEMQRGCIGPCPRSPLFVLVLRDDELSSLLHRKESRSTHHRPFGAPPTSTPPGGANGETRTGHSVRHLHRGGSAFRTIGRIRGSEIGPDGWHRGLSRRGRVRRLNSWFRPMISQSAVRLSHLAVTPRAAANMLRRTD